MNGAGGGTVDYTESIICFRKVEGLIHQHVAFTIRALDEQCLTRIFLNQDDNTEGRNCYN